MSLSTGAPNEGATKNTRFVDIYIELSRNKKKISHIRYDSRDNQNNILVKSTETPFCSSARVLLDGGADVHSTLRMFRKGSKSYDLMAPITVAAKYIVVDGSKRTPYFDQWKSIF